MVVPGELLSFYPSMCGVFVRGVFLSPFLSHARGSLLLCTLPLRFLFRPLSTLSLVSIAGPS